MGSQRRLTDRWRADLDGAAAAAESKLKGEFAYAEVAAAGADCAAAAAFGSRLENTKIVAEPRPSGQPSTGANRAASEPYNEAVRG